MHFVKKKVEEKRVDFDQKLKSKNEVEFKYKDGSSKSLDF